MFLVLERLDPEEQTRIESNVSTLIYQTLGAAVKDVRFDWTHVGEDEAKVEITINIERAADPKSWRYNFAGLTSGIKAAMGDKLESVFPVLMARAA